jgi:hypothetical protein
MGGTTDVYKISVINLNGRNNFGYVGIDGRLILNMDLVEIGCDDVDWTALAQDSIHW